MFEHGGFFSPHCEHVVGKSFKVLTHNGLSSVWAENLKCCKCGAERQRAVDFGY